jgi:hypothetical protein
MQLLTAGWMPSAIHAAAKLNLADHLQAGPLTASILAEKTQSHPRALYRLLRALSGIGIVTESAGQTFSLAPLGQYLISNTPGSLKDIAVMFGEEHYHAWGALYQSVQTGQSGFRHTYGTSVFEYFQANPESSEIFNRAMTTFSQQSRPVATAFNFGQFNTVMDVAGGHGFLLTAILQAYPTVRGMLFDLPHVVAGAPEQLTAWGVADRCKVVGGSFFESIPAGADAYVLSHILHDWDDASCLQILQQIAQVLPPEGRVLVVETLVGAPTETLMTRFMDLNMLVMTEGGCERTEAEFTQLFDAAGLKWVAAHPVAGLERYVIEAAKA